MQLSWLPRREREIADIVYAQGEASAAEICRALPDPLSNAAVRSMLTRLEKKGVLRRRKQGNRHFYAPAATDQAARESALRRVSRDHFGGSLAETVAQLLEMLRSDEAAALRPAQPPLHAHQPSPMARTRARPARQSGAGRIGAVPSGMSRDPDSIGAIRLSRLTSA